MLLQDLVERLEPLAVRGSVDREVTGVTQDSRKAGPGVVFVAIRGARRDGHDFVPGLCCEAVVVERRLRPASGVTSIQVPDSRAALATLAACVQGDPSEELVLVGITGTNGKTTTGWLVEAALREAGDRVGLLGTAGHRVDGKEIPASYTTPDAERWQALLRRIADAGCRVAVAEVSSIALAARRVDATRFAVGVFTGLSRDHLDYHGDMASYAAAKARLFRELLVEGGTAVLHVADPRSEEMLSARQDLRRWSFGLDRGDLRAEGLRLSMEGSAFTLVSPAGTVPVRLGLLGRHNVLNSLAAAGASLAAGAPLEAVASGLSSARGVPGRLERVQHPGGVHVLVDYAHTADALRTVLAGLRELCEGRLIVVFGCGGDRDRGKRPLMAKAAARGADLVVATTDNPRGEDPAAILDDMEPGLGPGAVREPDREQAIGRALATARTGDVVLIAGKGHERWQQVGEERRPFDDRLVAARWIAGEPR